MTGNATDSALLRYDLRDGAYDFSARRASELPYPVITGHQVHGRKKVSYFFLLIR